MEHSRRAECLSAHRRAGVVDDAWSCFICSSAGDSASRMRLWALGEWSGMSPRRARDQYTNIHTLLASPNCASSVSLLLVTRK
jgi:hypothetical protein